MFDEWTFVSGLCAQPFSVIDDLHGSFVALSDPPTRSEYNLESSANFGQNLVNFFSWIIEFISLKYFLSIYYFLGLGQVTYRSGDKLVRK